MKKIDRKKHSFMSFMYSSLEEEANLYVQENFFLDTGKYKEYKELIYQEKNKVDKKRNSHLSFLVTGIILSILGGMFFFLAFKKDVTGIKYFTPLSFEFILSLIALIFAVIFLTIAIGGLIKDHKKEKEFKKKFEKLKELQKKN